MPTGIYPHDALRGHEHTSEAQLAADKAHSARMSGRVPWNKGLRGSQVAWNRGLSRETDERVARYVEKTLPVLEKHRAAGWNRGLRMPAVSAARKRHIEQCDGSCGNPVCGTYPSPSNLAWRAYELFLQDFEIVIPEERFGRYRVDFLLAEEWLAIEVDGAYYHRDPTFDEERDAWLLANFGLPVVRLTEQEIACAAVEKRP
jgi:hypothetical protein